MALAAAAVERSEYPRLAGPNLSYPRTARGDVDVQAKNWTLETLRSTPKRRFMKSHANLKDLPVGSAQGLKVSVESGENSCLWAHWDYIIRLYSPQWTSLTCCRWSQSQLDSCFSVLGHLRGTKPQGCSRQPISYGYLETRRKIPRLLGHDPLFRAGKVGLAHENATYR